jgi:hypothetical protein
MNKFAKVFRKCLLPLRLLVVSLIAVSALLATIIRLGGFSVPVHVGTVGKNGLDSALEEVATQHYEAALESYRRSKEPETNLAELQAALSEIVRMWPDTLTAVRADQMRVAVARRQSGLEQPGVAPREILDEFVHQALARPEIYFAKSMSSTSSYIVASVISRLSSNQREGEAWKVCRSVRWKTNDIMPVAEVCEGVWQKLSWPERIWCYIAMPDTPYNVHVYKFSFRTIPVVFQILNYRLNPYRSRNVRKLAIALYRAGIQPVAKSLQNELLRLDVSEAGKMESELADLRGEKYSGTRFPNWNKRVSE